MRVRACLWLSTTLAFALLVGMEPTQASDVKPTITSERIAQAQHLLGLKKITLGPDDQYDSAVSPDLRFVVYTHKADLVAHLRIQSLSTGEVQDLLPLNADSQEATFGSDSRLLFTSFRANARGDICLLSLAPAGLAVVQEQGIKCLPRATAQMRTQRSHPFWVSLYEVGYLERGIEGQTAQIIFENLKTGERRTMVNGKIWAPQMHQGGRYLTFNRLVGFGGVNARRIVIVKDLMTGEEHEVTVQLPGMSGFPEISDDEAYLYFSQFTNDTNADQIIDGADDSEVFRLPMKAILENLTNQEILPEQLTSTESSCSFPKSAHELLYVTCAFEGSLDIYALPNSGVVPLEWNEARVQNAIATARSYQDRILLINNRSFRFHAKSGTEDRIDQEMLNDHLLNGDILSAGFYLQRLRARAGSNDLQFYDLLKVLLRAEELKQLQVSPEITREFRAQIVDLERQADHLLDAKKHRLPQSSFEFTVQSSLKQMEGEQRAAESLYQKSMSLPTARPMEAVLRFNLGKNLYSKPATASESSKRLNELLRLHKNMIQSPDADEQTQVYYSFELLKTIADFSSKPPERIAMIERFNSGLPKPTEMLLKSEIAWLRLVDSKTDKDKFLHYAELDKLMIASKADYFLRRALYVRAITGFADAFEFKFMGFVADNWLRYTSGDDIEFSFARETFALITLDRAYGNLAKGPNQLAASYFYQAVSLTDNLEAHYGFISMLNGMGQRKVIDDRYAALLKQNLVGDNMKFVDAVLILIDAKSKSEVNPREVDYLNLAILKLQSMTQDRNAAMRYLVLGSCYLEKFLRTANGVDFDSHLLDLANQNLLLAEDLGHANVRIRASALIDLGILHQRAQNHALASRYFSLRKKLEFVDREEQMRFSWLYARSLMLSHQSELAATELSSIPASAQLTGWTTPVVERMAFDWMDAGNVKKSAELYLPLLNAPSFSTEVKSERNRSVVALSAGFSALKAGRNAEAMSALTTAVRHAEIVPKEPKQNDEILEFEPKRVLLAAYGLLAQTQGDDASSLGTSSVVIDALEKQGELLKENHQLSEDWLSALIENRLQLVQALGLRKAQDEARAVKLMEEALLLSEKYAEQNHDLGQAVFRPTIDGLVFVELHPKLATSLIIRVLNKLKSGSLKAILEQKDRTTFLEVERFKIEILGAAFSEKFANGPPARAAIESLLKTPLTASLQSEDPVRWQELVNLSTALNSR